MPTPSKPFAASPWNPTGIVFHNTGGSSLEGAVAQLRRDGNSYNYIIDTNGTVTQLRNGPAGHAGVGIAPEFRSRGLGNANMVGIAHVGTGDPTPAQMEAARALSSELRSQYPGISAENIFGHGEFSPQHKEAGEGLSLASDIRSTWDGLRFSPEANPFDTPSPADPGQRSLLSSVDSSANPSATPSLEVTPSDPTGTNRPHEAMDFESYESFPSADTARLEPSFLFGGPSVETPTSTAFGSAGNLDTEPSFFASTTNPFDEWWKAAPEGPVTVSSGDGGSIWSGDDSLGAFADTSLGTDLSADLGSMNFGDRPAIDTPSPDEMAFNQPPPPGPLEETNEWTTSPGDRRFLPGSEPAEQTLPAGRGGDISSFGTFGNPLTLGSFFGHSLDAMRFGTDRYQPGITAGGLPEGLQPGEGYIDREAYGEGHWVRGETGDTWVENAGPRQPSPRNDGTGTTIIPIEKDFMPPAPPGMYIIGYDKKNGQPIYQDANGNKFVNPGTGTVMETAAQKAHGDRNWDMGMGPDAWMPGDAMREFSGGFRNSPNQGAEQMGRIRQTTTDAGHNQFGWEPGSMMFMDDEGGFESRSYARGTGNPALRGWAGLTTSARGRQSVATPLTGGR